MVNEDGSQVSVKIVILGEPAVGKTTLRKSFIGDRMTKDYSMTLGADIVVTSIQINDTTSLEAQIWDLAGQETFKPLTRTFVQGAHGAIVAFDLTRKDTFDEVSEWLDFLHEENPQLENNIPYIIVGNKADLTDFIKIDEQIVLDLVEYVNRLKVYSKTPTEYIETSAKTGYRVNEAFKRLAAIILQNFAETGQEEILDSIVVKSSSEDQTLEEDLVDYNSDQIEERTLKRHKMVEKLEETTPLIEHSSQGQDYSTTIVENSWRVSPGFDLEYPNPYDVVNTFIEIGTHLKIHDGDFDEEQLISQIHSHLPLDTLLATTSEGDMEYSLSTYRDAIDFVKIFPNLYFEIEENSSEVGKSLIIKNIDKLERAFNLYQKYKDPRVRISSRINNEILIESILSQGKLIAKKENTKRISIKLSRIQTASRSPIQSLADIPTLKLERSQVDKEIFSQSIISTTFAQLKRGWMVNPDLIRILNVVEQDVLHTYLKDEPILEISRIISSIQRLADIIYASNFGYLDYSLNSDIIDKMYVEPIETRSNLPESEAKDLVDFLNKVTSISPTFEGIASKMRKIGFCAKPLHDETLDLIVTSSTSDAIKQILSIVHVVSEIDDPIEQLRIMHNMITDPFFIDITEYYFNPQFELLHTPLLSSIQATIERLQGFLSSEKRSEIGLTEAHLLEISDLLVILMDYLIHQPQSKELVEIWSKVNDYLLSKIDFGLRTKSIDQVLNLIKGKEIILNIMTPLLLAKYEGRGYNPLASVENLSLDSKIKNITAIIALSSNLTNEPLQDLLNTMFIEAPEVSAQTVKKKYHVPRVSTSTQQDKKTMASEERSNLVPSPIGIGLARIANEYVTGGGERNLYKAITDLIKFTKETELKIVT